jgi:integrase
VLGNKLINVVVEAVVYAVDVLWVSAPERPLSGLREGELLGLMWWDLDLEAGKLSVRRALSETRNGPVFEAPKNGKGRSVKLTARAVEILRRLMHNCSDQQVGQVTQWSTELEVEVLPAGVGGDLRR